MLDFIREMSLDDGELLRNALRDNRCDYCGDEIVETYPYFMHMDTDDEDFVALCLKCLPDNRVNKKRKRRK